MTPQRFEMLTQAQRNIDLAYILAANGDHLASASNMSAARNLIFSADITKPPSRSVADHRENTGSYGACSTASSA